jgi:prevent-host-death family protein
MQRIGVRELRQNASVYLERVKKGESIEVTERGTPIAILSPAPGASLLERLLAEGTATGAKTDFHDWLNEPLPAPGPEQPTLTELILTERDDERY